MVGDWSPFNFEDYIYFRTNKLTRVETDHQNVINDVIKYVSNYLGENRVVLNV